MPKAGHPGYLIALIRSCKTKKLLIRYEGNFEHIKRTI